MALALSFHVGDDLYGLEIDFIQEVIESPVLFRIPGAREFLEGAINYRGNILSAINLPMLLGKNNVTPDSRRIILTPEISSLALSVTRLEKIISLEQFETVSDNIERQSLAIRATLQNQGCSLRMLDLDKVLQEIGCHLEGWV